MLNYYFIVSLPSGLTYWELDQGQEPPDGTIGRESCERLDNDFQV